VAQPTDRPVIFVTEGLQGFGIFFFDGLVLKFMKKRRLLAKLKHI